MAEEFDLPAVLIGDLADDAQGRAFRYLIMIRKELLTMQFSLPLVKWDFAREPGTPRLWSDDFSPQSVLPYL